MNVDIKYLIEEEEHTFSATLKSFNITYSQEIENSRCFLQCVFSTDLNSIIDIMKNNNKLQSITITDQNDEIVYTNTDWHRIVDINIIGNEEHVAKSIILSL